MYKNQLQELAQRSCFNLPSYSCIREGPDHAPRFKATVNFNGETFESPQYCTTLRQAEHSAAEMALNALASRGPSNSLAARILTILPRYEMYKSKLIILAQRSCLSLPSFDVIKEGPDHAPHFKAVVNFNGEHFASPKFYSTRRDAEQSAAEVALKALASRGPGGTLVDKILDETGVYKNLLQEVSQRVGASLPVYETFRSGLGHLPVFTCTVELAGIIFTGEPAKNKKQAEKNAAMAAWTSLKLIVQQQPENALQEKAKNDEQEHVTVARALQKYLIHARLAREKFPIRFPTQNAKAPSTVQPPATSSKILPFICPRQARNRAVYSTGNTGLLNSKTTPQSKQMMATVNEALISPKTTTQGGTAVNDYLSLSAENHWVKPKFPAAGAAPYIPIRHFGPHHRIAQPVTVRNAVPVFSSPPLPPPPPSQSILMMRPPASSNVAPPVCLRPATPGHCAPPPAVRLEQLSLLDSPAHIEEPPFPKPPTPKFDELGSRVLQTQPEYPPPRAKSIIGKVEEPHHLSNTTAILVDIPSSSTIPPKPEVLPVRIDLPVPKVPAISPAAP